MRNFTSHANKRRTNEQGIQGFDGNVNASNTKRAAQKVSVAKSMRRVSWAPETDLQPITHSVYQCTYESGTTSTPIHFISIPFLRG